MSKFTKNHSVGAELFLADRPTDTWTDMTKLIAVFRNFKKLLKSEAEGEVLPLQARYGPEDGYRYSSILP